jgi:hypothetical protein
LVLVGFFSLLISLVGDTGWNRGYGQTDGEEGTANLLVKRIDLLVNNQPAFALDAPGPVVTIQAVIGNDGTADAQGFDVHMQFRREDEPDFRADELCVPITCNDLSLTAGGEAQAIGILPTNNLSTGRYIIRGAIDPKNVAQLDEEDDSQEELLLIGITLPEFHPTSLTFRPPSPVSKGTQVTVRVQIENTGKPASPQLLVTFEYCLESPTCEFTSDGFQEGIKRLTSEQTRPLSEGRPLEVSDVLDTANLAPGSYLFRVRVEAIGVTELDATNNEISTYLTIGGGRPTPLCRLSGNVITLGKGASSKANVEILYLGVKRPDGRVSLHALRRQDVDKAEPGSVCPEIDGSPFSLSEDITSFALDQQVTLLYVGLADGRLVVVDTDNVDTLVMTSRIVASGFTLQALAPRLAGSGVGEVFIGAENGNLYRVRVTKDPQGQLSAGSAELCAGVFNPINTVLRFQGKIYFGAGNAVFRMEETRCDGSFEALPIAFTSPVRTLAIGRVTFGQTPSPRIVVGTEDGKLYFLNIFGQQLPGKPLFLELDAAITALAINDGERAKEQQQETIYVGTAKGSVHAIELRSHVEQCSFVTPTQQTINSLAVDNGKDGLPDTGMILAGSEDANLYVISEACTLVLEPQPTLGAIRAKIELDGNTSIDPLSFLLVPTGVTALYGGGSGLFKTEIPLSALP